MLDCYNNLQQTLALMKSSAAQSQGSAHQPQVTQVMLESYAPKHRYSMYSTVHKYVHTTIHCKVTFPVTGVDRSSLYKYMLV